MQIKRDLNKADIFKLGDDITIFSKYLNIPEADIIHCIETETLMESPVRDDDNDASAGFKYNNKGKLKLRDFNGCFWGDCFDAVAFVLGLNVNHKSSFRTILKHVEATLKAKDGDAIYREHVNRNILKTARQRKRIIDIQTRAWNTYDRHYWNPYLYGVRDIFAYLEYHNIYPIEHYWIDAESQPNPKYYYKGNNPAYAYFLGYDADGIANYRIYIPFNKKPFSKFITNNSAWQGLDYITDDLDAMLITKSYKDRTSILSFIADCKYNIGVIAPPSENHVVSKREYDWLASNVKLKFADTNKPAMMSLYDFDKTGVFGSGHLKREFDVPRIMFTNGKYGTSITGNKDFTDTIPMYRKKKFHSLIHDYINKLELI